LADLVDEAFLAYNAARLREACQLFTKKMLEPEVTVGLTLTGALTPAGLGISALIPLIKAGFVDWIISTGANLYHDTHFGIGLSMHQGDAQTSDIVLRQEEVVRIYDIFFDYSVLLDTDTFFRRIIEAPDFQKSMSTAEFHYLCGRYVHEREQKLGFKEKSLLAVAYEYEVPIYTSSPGDSSIGMNVAAKALQGNKLAFDPSRDVNETAAIVLGAKRNVLQQKSRKKRPKTLCCRLNRRSRKYWASMSVATTISCRSRMHALTPVACPARPLAKQSRGGRSIPIACLTQWSVMSIRRSLCQLLPLMRWPGTSLANLSGFTAAARN
jgi:deoxyhypusine synthase